MPLNRKDTKMDFVAVQQLNHMETKKITDKLPKSSTDHKVKNTKPRQN